MSDSDVDLTLTQTGTNWTLTDHNDITETYATVSSTEARLSSSQSRNGYTQTLSYGTNQITVTDSYGRSLALNYLKGLLQTVTTPDNTVLTYGYASSGLNPGVLDRLTTVAYSTVPQTSQTYLYENAALPLALTGITDEDGNRYATWAYDAFGRAISNYMGSSTTQANATTIQYDDATGNRTVTNALGQSELYKFTTLQGIPKLTEIDRQATATTAAATRLFTYDSNGYMASQTDWNGNKTTFVSNSHGSPTTINEAVGTTAARTTTIAYDKTWVHLPGTIVTAGLTTGFTYDGSGEALTKTLTDTTSTTSPYSTNGQTRTWTNTWSNYLLASAQTPNGNTTKYGYDSTGALTSVTDALKHVTNITSHTGGGYPRVIVDANSATTTLNYNARMWRSSSTVSGTSGTYKTQWAYDAAGNLTQTTLPDGSSLANTYDTAHRLTQVTDALGNYTTYTLDGLGDRTATNVYTAKNALTWQRSGTFDALGRELVETGGASQTTTRTYDSNGNVLTVKDALSNTTTNAYDALNRLSKSTDQNKGVTTPAYDTHDRVLSVSDANRNTTAYVRDGFGDVIQQSSPDSGVTVYYYDGDANLTSKIDALKIVTNQTFDALDRPLTTTYPADTAENVAYTYDQTGTGFSFGIGRLTSVTDAAGSLTRTYEERGDLLSEVRVNGKTTLTTGYTYDGANRVATMTYPDGTLVTYSHDLAGNVSTVTGKPAGSSTTTTLATLTHEPFGPINSAAYGNGTAETWTLDASYRPMNITDALSGSNVQNLTYKYDLANNVSTITDAVNAANSQQFTYDGVNRLLTAASGTGGYGSYTWTYDLVGNRKTQVAGSSTLTYGYTAGTNRLATITPSTTKAMLRTRPTIHLGTKPTVAVASYLSPKLGWAHRANAPPSAVQPSPSVLLILLGWPMLLTGFAGIFSLRKRLRVRRFLVIVFLLSIFTGSATLLSGCLSGSTSVAPAPVAAQLAFGGIVHGGQQPVTGSTIQLYAVGTTGDGSAATALLKNPVQTDGAGNFSITSDYTCPSSSTLVYLVASGGNPGMAAGTNNKAITMLAALGSCGTLQASTFVFVDEVTTVGSLAALYPYMTSVANLGSGSGDAAQLTAAFTAVGEYTSTTTGIAPGPALPAGYYASSIEINTLGDIVASCINSAGGTAGDGSACGTLFSAAKPSSGTAPTDIVGAILGILKNPTQNVGSLFALTSATAPFQPSLIASPASWSLPIEPLPAAPTFSVPEGTYSSAQTVAISATSGTTIYYTTDGTTPTTSSTKYTGSITVGATEQISALAALNPFVTGPDASAVYNINTSSGITITTNANGNITGVPTTDGVYYAIYSYNNANRPSSVAGTALAASYVYDWAGQRISKTNNGTPATLYSYSQGGAVIAENDNGSVTDYVYVDGRPIAVIQPTATLTANRVSYVMADRLGTPQLVTNSSGSAVWSTTYQPFGTTSTVNASIEQNLRFPGQLADLETGFNYNINREYMPNLGRYLETDRLGLRAGTNGYLYADASPLSFSDPTGQFIQFVGLGVGAVSGAISGYIATGKWQGAVIGGVVGGAVGFFAPELSGAAAEAAAELGLGIAGQALIGAGVFSGYNGVGSVVSTLGNNLVLGEPPRDGLGESFVIGAAIPLADNEAIVTGILGADSGILGEVLGSLSGTLNVAVTGIQQLLQQQSAPACDTSGAFINSATEPIP